MTTPASAFAPGNPASAGVVEKALSGGIPGVSVPGFTSSSSAASGDITSVFNSDSSGFSVNYGSGVSQGAGGMLLVAAAILVGVWLWKRST